jgi:hypothetical protein
MVPYKNKRRHIPRVFTFIAVKTNSQNREDLYEHPVYLAPHYIPYISSARVQTYSKVHPVSYKISPKEPPTPQVKVTAHLHIHSRR